MSISHLRVFGLEDSTCGERYCDAQTTTLGHLSCEATTLTASTEPAEPMMVTLRVADLLTAIRACLSHQAAWIDDFRDDPIVVTHDLYDVLLAYERMRRAA